MTGELLEGPSRDFNLMWKRACVTAQTWRRPLVGPMVLFVDRSETWVIYLLAGQAEFNAECGLPRMQQGDTAILQGGDERTRYALEGGEVPVDPPPAIGCQLPAAANSKLKATVQGTTVAAAHGCAHPSGQAVTSSSGRCPVAAAQGRAAPWHAVPACCAS